MTAFPKGLPSRYHVLWREPWRETARTTVGFRRWLDRNGYLSPHFTLAEAACHDGTQIPRRLRARARNHAFHMERFRHALGDVAITPISWYRTPAYNRQIHGAINSRHTFADAADVDAHWVDEVGRVKVQRVAEAVFSHGGVGTYPAGSMHFDSRGYRARWSSFVGW